MGLEEERKKIDEIDAKVLSLIGERLAIAKKIAEEKRKKGEEVLVPAREKEVLESLVKNANGKIPREAVEAIYSEVLSASRQAQERQKIAFLGPRTTFTHMAALKKFGSMAEFIAKDSIKEVFDAVEKKEAAYGVVPIENSTEGTVNHTLDMFIDSDLGIVGEIQLEINHCLLSKFELFEVKKVYSHPQAFAQCRNWLGKNLPTVELVESPSTAKAAEEAKLYLKSAAIASELAAKDFGLNVLAKNIEDSAHNFTRFFVIGKASMKRTGKDKTSLVFSVKHEAGSLFNALKAFHEFNVNMTKIESRPTKKKTWEYVFFVDVQGFIEDEKVKKALERMKQNCMFLRVLGSYPEEAISE
ncbi:MAG: prephenate dehydratase [Candidatus Diapherotrites archaeon]